MTVIELGRNSVEVGGAKPCCFIVINAYVYIRIRMMSTPGARTPKYYPRNPRHSSKCFCYVLDDTFHADEAHPQSLLVLRVEFFPQDAVVYQIIALAPLGDVLAQYPFLLHA